MPFCLPKENELPTATVLANQDLSFARLAANCRGSMLPQGEAPKMVGCCIGGTFIRRIWDPGGPIVRFSVHPIKLEIQFGGFEPQALFPHSEMFSVPAISKILRVSAMHSRWQPWPSCGGSRDPPQCHCCFLCHAAAPHRPCGPAGCKSPTQNGPLHPQDDHFVAPTQWHPTDHGATAPKPSVETHLAFLPCFVACDKWGRCAGFAMGDSSPGKSSTPSFATRNSARPKILPSTMMHLQRCSKARCITFRQWMGQSMCPLPTTEHLTLPGR